MSANEALPAYQYSPLTSPDETRILILEPSTDPTSPLVVSIKQAGLLDFTDTYEALSYTWGAPHLIYTLQCDGAQIPITESLDRALRALRNHFTRRTLWADGVCINQADEHDKTTQIPQMFKIFRCAMRVVVWLGVDEGSEEEETVKRLSRLSRSSVENMEPVWDELWIDKKASLSVARIEKVLALPWFQRMWIIQEVVSSLDVVVLCGTAEIQWARFVIALRMFRKRIGDIEGVDSPEDRLQERLLILKIDRRLMGITQIFDLWKTHGNLNESSMQDVSESDVMADRTRPGGIIELMNGFAHHQCSDERDRIFALVGLASDVSTSPLPRGVQRTVRNLLPVTVDYAESVQQVYRRFAGGFEKSSRL
ncbi:HET-domain-containing protein [Amniculicola lignicola CBS 123094]|uniref:HET-domain-containing protein n=1 Tax=Amniculicola lignicola CBS 123094 TaxID=1392246 RepID=A0A6A5WQT8_9PLEO|nr:HET-domain-containing protein [Amniculicola lignicola CBS 123094]